MAIKNRGLRKVLGGIKRGGFEFDIATLQQTPENYVAIAQQIAVVLVG